MGVEIEARSVHELGSPSRRSGAGRRQSWRTSLVAYPRGRGPRQSPAARSPTGRAVPWQTNLVLSWPQCGAALGRRVIKSRGQSIKMSLNPGESSGAQQHSDGSVTRLSDWVRGYTGDRAGRREQQRSAAVGVKRRIRRTDARGTVSLRQATTKSVKVPGYVLPRSAHTHRGNTFCGSTPKSLMAFCTTLVPRPPRCASA